MKNYWLKKDQPRRIGRVSFHCEGCTVVAFSYLVGDGVNFWGCACLRREPDVEPGTWVEFSDFLDSDHRIIGEYVPTDEDVRRWESVHRRKGSV